MIRPIMRSIGFLKEKSEEASAGDIEIVRDLQDTLKAHAHECVGMAANMIGEKKRIIIFEENGKYTVMLNPKIIKADGAYQTVGAAFLLWANAPASVTVPSRCSIRPKACRRALKPTKTAPRRSSSMKWITWKA